MLGTQPKRLSTELTRVNRELKNLTTDLGDAARFVEIAINLAEQSADACRRVLEHLRRHFNQMLFERTEVVMDENDDHQLRAIIAPPFDELISAQL